MPATTATRSCRGETRRPLLQARMRRLLGCIRVDGPPPAAVGDGAAGTGQACDHVFRVLDLQPSPQDPVTPEGSATPARVPWRFWTGGQPSTATSTSSSCKFQQCAPADPPLLSLSLPDVARSATRAG